MLEETGRQVPISTEKQALYWHNLKGCSARKKPLLQNHHEKPDYSFQMHMETKILLFGEISSSLMKQNLNCLAIMASYLLRKKDEACKLRNTIPNMKHGDGSMMGVLCSRRDWSTSQNRCHHEEGKLRGYIETTSQDISNKVKVWSQMGLPNGQ